MLDGKKFLEYLVKLIKYFQIHRMVKAHEYNEFINIILDVSDLKIRIALLELFVNLKENANDRYLKSLFGCIINESKLSNSIQSSSKC